MSNSQLSSLHELESVKLLIGEGKDELRFFKAFLAHLGITQITVEEYGGKNRLPDYLDLLEQRTGFHELQSIGVTRDGDLDTRAAFTSVCNHLTTRGFVAPASIGTIATGNPSIGVMIFPDGVRSGMLEDLCLAMLDGDPLLNCVDNYFNCSQAAIGQLPQKLSKARIHAWLSTQSPPDLRLGEAAERGLLDWDNSCFNLLKAFLRAL